MWNSINRFHSRCPLFNRATGDGSRITDVGFAVNLGTFDTVIYEPSA